MYIRHRSCIRRWIRRLC